MYDDGDVFRVVPHIFLALRRTVYSILSMYGRVSQEVVPNVFHASPRIAVSSAKRHLEDDVGVDLGYEGKELLRASIFVTEEIEVFNAHV